MTGCTNKLTGRQACAVPAGSMRQRDTIAVCRPQAQPLLSPALFSSPMMIAEVLDLDAQAHAITVAEGLALWADLPQPFLKHASREWPAVDRGVGDPPSKGDRPDKRR